MSVLVATFSFFRMCDTWVATVRRESISRAAISGLDRPFLDERRDLELGVGERVPAADRAPVLAVRPAPDAVGPELGLNPVEVRLGPEELVHLDRLLERLPGGGPLLGLDEALGRGFQGLGPGEGPPGVGVPLRGGQQDRRVPVDHAAAVKRVRLLVRDL